MKLYFQLQYSIINRKIRETGIEPWMATILLGIIFTGFCYYLSYKTTFAPHLMVLFAASLMISLTKKNRSEFIILTYGTQMAKRLRFIENLITTIPFILFLLYHQQFILVLILLFISYLISTVKIQTIDFKSFPTPYSHHPFEFIVGFRKNLYLIIGTLIILIIALKVDNFNLAIATLITITIIQLYYYSTLENPYFIWSYSLDSAAFLNYKIKRALIQSLYLILPIGAIISSFYPQNYHIVGLSIILGMFYLILMVVAKYSEKDGIVKISQFIHFILCLVFPPFLLFFIPYYYKKSSKLLMHILQ